MAVVVVGFVLSSIYAEMVVARIHGAANDISRDKAPSVLYLSAARADMHQLEGVVRDFVTTGAEVNVEQIQAFERRLQADLASYVSLPTDEEERSFVDAIVQQMGDLREETGLAVAHVQGGDERGAGQVIRDRLRPTIDRARDLIVADIELNARQAREDAAKIDTLRARSARVTLYSDVLMTVIAVATAWFAGQMLRRSARVIEVAAERERERASELDLFAARVAHDVLSPLAPVGLSLNLLSRRFPGDSRAQELIDKGQEALHRARALVDDLLDFARSGAKGSLDAIADVARTCQQVAEELEEEAARAQVTLCLEPMGPLVVRCHEVLLADVLRNLLRNAIRHMGDVERREVRVRAGPRGAWVLIEVEDTGPGLPEGSEPRIFDPYVRGRNASAPGLGLGLATVKRIIEAHQGEVGARNRREGGAVFWLRLRSGMGSETQPATH